jgi:hypothetical protein
MDFIKNLHEARLTRGADNRPTLTYTDCKEKAFLILLMLTVMRYYRTYRPRAGAYSRKTNMYREYDRFRQDGTDLYNLVYFITGNEEAINKLKDPGAAKKLRNVTHLSVSRLNSIMRNTANDDNVSKDDIINLGIIERDLQIKNNDYKQIRRYLASYTKLTQNERKTLVTRLLFAARAKLADSDLITDFSKLATDNKLEDFNAASPEPEINSLEDVALADVKNYRFILSPASLPYISRFMQSARSGKSVVANLVQSYLPIIIMVDDIVKAGPAYIEQLKVVHNRAKRDLKK